MSTRDVFGSYLLDYSGRSNLSGGYLAILQTKNTAILEGVGFREKSPKFKKKLAGPSLDRPSGAIIVRFRVRGLWTAEQLSPCPTDHLAQPQPIRQPRSMAWRSRG
jgi:hypothetical protein